MEGILKIKQLKSCYLIYGEEAYLKNEALKEIHKNAIGPEDLMNYNLFEGKDVTAEAIINACDTMPFFADYKVVVVKDGEFFKTGKKEESDRLNKWIKDIAPQTILVFIEKEVDKRSALYKSIQKQYEVVEGNPLSYDQIQQFVHNTCLEKKINMPVKVQHYFISNMPQDLTHILREIDKIQSFCMNQEVTIDTIDTICVFALEQRVFTLVKKVTTKDLTEALKIYHRLIESKESPVMILVLIARQYRILLQIKYMDKMNMGIQQIAKEAGVPTFAAKEMLGQSRNFNFRQLQDILDFCLESDTEIKTGKMEAVKSVELLIMKCS